MNIIIEKKKLILLKGNHYANFNISSILPNLNQDLDEYYRYYGSLTTPPCDEGINLNILDYLFIYSLYLFCNQGVVSFCLFKSCTENIFNINLNIDLDNI